MLPLRLSSRALVAGSSIAIVVLLATLGMTSAPRVGAQTPADLETTRRLARGCARGDLAVCEELVRAARGRIAVTAPDQRLVRDSLREGCKRGSGPACGLAFDMIYAGQWGETANPADAVRYGHAGCALGDVHSCAGQLVVHMEGVDDHAPSILLNHAGLRPFGELRQRQPVTLAAETRASAPSETPPRQSGFALIHYPSVRSLDAYVTVDPGDHARHPAILWLTGGDTNSVSDVWSAGDASNEQTAAAYRRAGVVMMFPTLRGGNGDTGPREGFRGEVDDVLAAARHLATLPYVDPARIYLGGHSTGGTLALLVAEASSVFRAAFVFGPVATPAEYGDDFVLAVYPDTPDQLAFRSPMLWLESIRSPTFVIEGDQEPGNAAPVSGMANAPQSASVRFYLAGGYDHFSVLDPMNRVIARKILADTGATTNITLAASDFAGLRELPRPVIAEP